MSRMHLTTAGLVLKRSNTGEADRVVTLLTKERGKIVCVAKGVRKMGSTQRAYLEPGNIVKAYLIETKSMPLLTQTTCTHELRNCRRTLPGLRSLTQILEIFDKLMVEEALDDFVFGQITDLIKLVDAEIMHRGKIQQALGGLLVNLGYQELNETAHLSIMDYVSELAETRLHSFEYLRLVE